MKEKFRKFLSRWESIQAGLREFRRERVRQVILQREPESSAAVLKQLGVLVNHDKGDPK